MNKIMNLADPITVRETLQDFSALQDQCSASDTVKQFKFDNGILVPKQAPWVALLDVNSFESHVYCCSS